MYKNYGIGNVLMVSIFFFFFLLQIIGGQYLKGLLGSEI